MHLRLDAACRTLLLFSFLLGGVVEPSVGLLRDGVVHHESMATAYSHQQRVEQVGHGHEEAGSSTVPQSDAPDHEHGTGSDHCTHVHSPAVASAVQLTFAFAFERLAPVFQPSGQSTPRQVHAPPPKTA